MNRVALLDCTLRDGAYIVDADFGAKKISGIIKKMQEANVEIIECGWLKDGPHKYGTTYYHVPDDLKQYLTFPKNPHSLYVAMIDYNRYDCSRLPPCDGETIDAIRVVFPKGKAGEGTRLVKEIRDKGYKVFLQAANTLGYSDKEILELVDQVNEVKPEGLSVVDTFGAMYPADLRHISMLIHKNLDSDIRLGFHSHNNQQLSFSLSMQFIEEMKSLSERSLIVDSSLCGMGRGAGNCCTELIAGYLNEVHKAGYDLNVIFDTIDIYMTKFIKEYSWGYSIPYSIAGMYQCHVNNVAYLMETHRIKTKDMRIIFDSLDTEKRRQYDYDYLENVYEQYQNNLVDDSSVKDLLYKELTDKKILVVLPGSSSHLKRDCIKKYIESENAVVVGINAIIEEYAYDWVFYTSKKKYEYSKEGNKREFSRIKKILTSNIKTDGNEKEFILNYNDLQKRGWKYYDNSMMMFLRLMMYVRPSVIAVAGFDGFEGSDSNYVKEYLHPNISKEETAIMQAEIKDMLSDFIRCNNGKIKIRFITESPFSDLINNS